MTNLTNLTNLPDLLASTATDHGPMTEDAARTALTETFGQLDLADKRVLVVIPDSTRTAPIPMMFGLLGELLGETTAALDYLVALGTHMPMDDAALSKLVGAEVVNNQAGRHGVFNHKWDDEATFTNLGTLTTEDIETLSGGQLALDVPVKANKLVEAYDLLVVCGPVFPHEVMGFSGGNKYFYPGIAAPELIDVTHWMGALLTSKDTIGTPDTPMRRMIDHAAEMIPTPKLNLAMVMHGQDLVGLFTGSMKGAWRAAVELSAKLDIIYVEKPFRRVLAVMPEMYDDLWTGAKGMYKMEPAIADGGEVVIYAPHITEVSYTHGALIDEIGYHVRDYFTDQWEKFKDYPWGILAHSTHLRGAGTYIDGVETARIRVTLATGIGPERCAKIGLGYLDPAAVNPDDWAGNEELGILLVPRAGEMLYRLAE